MARYFPEKIGFIGKLGISRESGTLHFLYSSLLCAWRNSLNVMSNIDVDAFRHVRNYHFFRFIPSAGFTKVWSLGHQCFKNSRFWSHWTVVKINIPPGEYILEWKSLILIIFQETAGYEFTQKLPELQGKFKVRKHKVWAKPKSHSVAWIPAPS